MKNSVKSVAAIFILLTFSVFCFAQTDWIGGYEFEEDGGKTAGGTPIFVVHQLDLLETDDGLIAIIQSNGFHTSRDLVATTKLEGSKLFVYFRNYGENNTFETFKAGDLLFTLEQKVNNGSSEVFAFWDKFQPFVSKSEWSGKGYFQKVGSND